MLMFLPTGTFSSAVIVLGYWLSFLNVERLNVEQTDFVSNRH